MVTDYLQNVSHWESWQQAYQFGVFLIIPPDPPATQVNNLRSMYDPKGQSYCQAHISLSIPLPRPLTAVNMSELRRIASSTKPFVIHYGPLINYSSHAGVILAIKPQDTLDSLVTVLEAASVFKGAPVRRYPFSAHMTIAEFISVERTKELMSELKGLTPEGDFLCDTVSYVVPDESFHFTERVMIELGH